MEFNFGSDPEAARIVFEKVDSEGGQRRISGAIACKSAHVDECDINTICPEYAAYKELLLLFVSRNPPLLVHL